MLKLVVSGVSVSYSLMQSCFLGRVEGCDHFCISSVLIYKLIRESAGNTLPTLRFWGMECLSSSQDILAWPHLFALKFRLIFHLLRFLTQLHWITPTDSLCCDRICLICCVLVILGLCNKKGSDVLCFEKLTWRIIYVHEMHINRFQLDFQSFSTLQWLLPVFLPTLGIGILKQPFFKELYSI